MAKIHSMIPLTEEQEAAGLKSIGYNKKQLMEDVKMLRTWLEEQHHLPPSRLKESDYFLIRFLTGCKGSLEKSKKKMDAYYTSKTACRSIFEDYDPCHETNEEAMKFVHTMIFPQAAPDSTRIYYAHIAGPFTGNFTAVFRNMFQLFEIAMREPEISSSNFIAITNLAGSTAEMVTRLSPSLAKDVFHLIQEVYPFRMERLVYVNASPAMETATNYLVKPFLAEKVKKRFAVTSSGPEIAKEWVPSDMLPTEWGGSSKSLDEISGMWREIMISQRDHFLNEWSEKVDESKRAEGNKSSNPYFGLEGSIKKLCLD